MPIGLIKNNLKLMLRSKWILVLMTLFPPMVIIMLSSVFESMMDADYTIPPFSVGLHMENNNNYQDAVPALSEIFRENDITLLEFPNSNIEELMANGTVAVFVEADNENFTIYRTIDHEVEAAVVESIFSSFFYKIDEMTTIVTYQMENGMMPTAGVNDGNDNLFGYKKAAVNPLPSSRDYYGIIEIVYFLWIGIISLAAVISSERKNRIESRMRVTPVSKWNLYLGKFIPCVLAMFLETFISVLISVVLLDVHWGNWAGSVFILTLSVLAAAAFGMVLFTLFKSIAVSVIIGWLVLFGAGFIGGTFQTYMFSTVPDSVAELSPLYYINRTLVEFSTMGHSDYALPATFILIAILAVSVVLGYFINNGKAGMKK